MPDTEIQQKPPKQKICDSTIAIKSVQKIIMKTNCAMRPHKSEDTKRLQEEKNAHDLVHGVCRKHTALYGLELVSRICDYVAHTRSYYRGT